LLLWRNDSFFKLNTEQTSAGGAIDNGYGVSNTFHWPRVHDEFGHTGLLSGDRLALMSDGIFGNSQSTWIEEHHLEEALSSKTTGEAVNLLKKMTTSP
jgi:hypothetical protein